MLDRLVERNKPNTTRCYWAFLISSSVFELLAGKVANEIVCEETEIVKLSFHLVRPQFVLRKRMVASNSCI